MGLKCLLSQTPWGQSGDTGPRHPAPEAKGARLCYPSNFADLEKCPSALCQPYWPYISLAEGLEDNQEVEVG